MVKPVKSYFVTVTDENHKTVMTRQLFYVKEANDLHKEMKEKYKDNPGYTVFKEYY